MSRSKDAELILRLLMANEKACLKTIDIVESGKWSSGSQITRALHELEKEGLIDFFETEALVQMTADAILRFRHSNYKSLTSVRYRVKRTVGPYIKPIAYSISGVIAFVWVMLSQVLAPEKYCGVLPNMVTEWLATCTSLNTDTKS